MAAKLILTDGVYETLCNHLLPPGATCEEAAFGFARTSSAGDQLVFELLELYPVPPEGFVEHSRYFLHLTDETRARVVKRAHDLTASLIEFHSHPLQRTAEFSPSDLAGFDEFVPHVKWRLKQRPYAAFVFTPSSFDGLAWPDDVATPLAFDSIAGGTRRHVPTNMTFRNWRQ